MSLPVSIKEVPFFKLILPFLAGIASQYWLNLFSFSWWNYAIVLLLLGLVFLGFLLASHWRFRWSYGLAINLFLFFFGAILTVKQPVSDKLIANRSNQAILYLLDNPQLRTRSIRVEAKVRFLKIDNIWWPANERMLVYFDVRDSLAADLSYGSEISIR